MAAPPRASRVTVSLLTGTLPPDQLDAVPQSLAPLFAMVAARVSVPVPVTEDATENGTPAVTAVRMTVDVPEAVAIAAVVVLAFQAAIRPAEAAAAVCVPPMVKVIVVTVPSS